MAPLQGVRRSERARACHSALLPCSDLFTWIPLICFAFIAAMMYFECLCSQLRFLARPGPSSGGDVGGEVGLLGIAGRPGLPLKRKLMKDGAYGVQSALTQEHLLIRKVLNFCQIVKIALYSYTFLSEALVSTTQLLHVIVGSPGATAPSSAQPLPLQHAEALTSGTSSNLKQAAIFLVTMSSDPIVEALREFGP